MKDLIQEKIIGPIMRLKPKFVSQEDWLATVFNTTSRIISTYFVKEKFKLPGLYLVNDAIPTDGAGDEFRQVKRMDYILARVDDRDGNYIHVDHRGHVFLLNRMEWNLLLKYLQLREGNESI